MIRIGVMLVLLGTIAIVLDFVNMVPSVLIWIYTWGNGVAWAIKIGITVLGAIILWACKKTKINFGKQNRFILYLMVLFRYGVYENDQSSLR